MNWFLEALRKYAVFSGRSRRKEYGFFFLGLSILLIVVRFFEGAVGLSGDSLEDPGVLSGLVSLAMLLPILAVTIRRLHDLGKSGWWLLLNLIPLVNLILVLMLLFKDGTPGPNQYGPSPKA